MLEKSYEIKISKLKFNIRIDRIDFINKKNKLLIDYKTAKNPTSRKELFSDMS
jgi:RecB family exonuclease